MSEVDTFHGSATAGSPPAVAVSSIPVRTLLPWLLSAALLALVAMHFVSAEQ